MLVGTDLQLTLPRSESGLAATEHSSTLITNETLQHGEAVGSPLPSIIWTDPSNGGVFLNSGDIREYLPISTSG